MSENFVEYLIALADEPVLFDQYKSDPNRTLADARISKEEKLAMRSGDPVQIKSQIQASLIEGQSVPDRVYKLIEILPKVA